MNAPTRRRLTLAAIVLSAVPAGAALAATPPDQIDRLTVRPSPSHVAPDQIDRLAGHVPVVTSASNQRTSRSFTPADQADRSAEAHARARAGLSLSTSLGVGFRTTPDQADRSAEARARARAGLSLSKQVKRAHVLP